MLEIDTIKTFYEIKHQRYARIDGMRGESIDKGKIMFNLKLVMEQLRYFNKYMK